MQELPRRILVVEDEPAAGMLLSLLLESSGYEVSVANCGATALSFAADQRPDLVLLDLRLPDLPGYQVCRELRKLSHSWEFPIIMLTAMDRPIDQLRGFAYGADAYLTKPYDSSELLKTISILLRETVFT
ncbi:MAG: response regulator [Elusimicrobia bacterium]|nr:response regulator [Elusimicrobiota bacterium]